MARNQVRSSKKRTLTAVIQGVCGLLAVACGIALIPLRGDERYMPWEAWNVSSTIANVGFGIWGGVIIFVTAVLGCIYREKKAKISIYAVLSVVSMAVAAILFSVAIVGLASFANPSTWSCQYVSPDDDNMSEYPCCSRRNRCYSEGYRMSYQSYSYTWTAPMTDPLSNYDSPECRNVRRRAREIAKENCRYAVRSSKPATTSVYAILLLVSVVEFIASVTAAVLSFIEVCRGCCEKINWKWTNRNQQVYLAYPANGQPESVPMILVPMSTGPRSPQMTGAAPNAMTSSYPPQMAFMNPNMASGLFPFPMPAVPQGYVPGPQGVCTGTDNADDAKQREAAPPPQYEAEPGTINDG